MYRGRSVLLSGTVVLFLAIFFYSQVLGQNDTAATSNSGFLEVEGGKIFYDAAGQGRTVILIHDGLIHRETWDAQFPVFSRGSRVVRYDRRGYGKSPKPEKAYSNVEDLRQIFEALNIEKASLIGMSAGGGLAIDFALKYPDKVDALVLVGAVVSGFGYTEHFQTRGGHFKPEDAANPQTLREYFARDPYIIYGGNKDARDKAAKLLKDNPQNLDPETYRFVRPPERPGLGNLSEILVPALIVVGEFDIPDVHAHAGAIQAGIRNSRRVVLSNAGHLVPMEQPDVFNRLVLNFLRDKDFMHLLVSQGVSEAVRVFKEAKASNPEAVLFGESVMNEEAYRRLRAGQAEEAIELFKLNVLAYPRSANTYDSLAEACERTGRMDEALKNYEMAVRVARETNDPRLGLFQANCERFKKSQLEEKKK